MDRELPLAKHEHNLTKQESVRKKFKIAQTFFHWHQQSSPLAYWLNRIILFHFVDKAFVHLLSFLTCAPILFLCMTQHGEFYIFQALLQSLMLIKLRGSDWPQVIQLVFFLREIRNWVFPFLLQYLNSIDIIAHWCEPKIACVPCKTNPNSLGLILAFLASHFSLPPVSSILPLHLLISPGTWPWPLLLLLLSSCWTLILQLAKWRIKLS